MAKAFLSDDAKKALSDAVHFVESRSSAELVIAVRARSGSYLHADLIAGILAALASLIALLFSPQEFDLIWFVIDPLVVGALAGLAASRLPVVRRALTVQRLRRRNVVTAARSTFLEKRVHGTSGRTGLLLYISLLEHEATVIHDLGVDTLAITEGWRRVIEEIEEGVRRGESGVTIANWVRELGDVLAPALTRSADDVDELANEICETP